MSPHSSLTSGEADLAVRMTGINKRFGAVAANANVALAVAQGTVHGLVGENGAGKSTLMSILYGFYQADSGSIEVFGKLATIRNADEAIALGIGMVHQHFMLVDTLTALENVMLGAEPHWLLGRAECNRAHQVECTDAGHGSASGAGRAGQRPVSGGPPALRDSESLVPGCQSFDSG